MNNSTKRKRKSGKDKQKQVKRRKSKNTLTYGDRLEIPMLQDLCLSVLSQSERAQDPKTTSRIAGVASLQNKLDFYANRKERSPDDRWGVYSTAFSKLTSTDLKEVLRFLLFEDVSQNNLDNRTLSIQHKKSLIRLGCTKAQYEFVSTLYPIYEPHHSGDITSFLTRSIDSGDFDLIKYWLQNRGESSKTSVLKHGLRHSLQLAKPEAIDYFLQQGAPISDISDEEMNDIVIGCLTHPSYENDPFYSLDVDNNGPGDPSETKIANFKYLVQRFPELHLPSVLLKCSVAISEVCAQSGYLGVLKWIVNMRPPVRVMPVPELFDVALEEGWLNIIRYLVEERNARSSTTGSFGSVFNLCLKSNDVSVAQYLLDSPLYFKSESHKQFHLDNISTHYLSDAVCAESEEIIRFLAPWLKPNEGDDHWVPLVLAGKNQNGLEIVKILVENAGADVERTMWMKQEGHCSVSAVLAVASAYGRLDIVKYLVESAGADVNAGKGDALCSAQVWKQEEVKAYLIEKGASVDVLKEHHCRHFAYLGDDDD